LSEYKSDLTINKHQLDEELVIQPELYMKYAEQHADALMDRDRSKENLDVLRAEIDSEIRGNWEAFGFDKKPTENAIAGTITKDEKYREASSELIEKNRDSNILASAKEAMNHKKSALSKLVELYLAGYYAEVPMPKDKKEDIVDKKITNQKKTVRKQLSKKRGEK